MKMKCLGDGMAVYEQEKKTKQWEYVYITSL